MKSAWQKEARQDLLTRLDQLTPDAKGRWGKMNCYQMLAHIADAVRMPLGELKTKPKKTPLRFAPVKKLIIYVLPFPKGAPTAPELIARTEGDWNKEAVAVKELLARFAELQNQETWPEHPAFGKLSKKDWGALVYKHIDHHFRQFGV
jgi:hypothetical protein